MSGKRNLRVRQRPVSFGNPALGTYHGFVYTQQNGADDSSCITSAGSSRSVAEGASEVHRLVAMVNVPPHQVPEGILNLARSHRPWIDRVRIVIAENDRPAAANPKESKEEEKRDDICTVQPSPLASAMECAASILASEQRRTAAEENQHNEHFDENETQHQERTYLVLIELCSEEAADALVEDLHGQAYTSLDETETCSVHHVVALKGVAGVSLMSPFFAPSSPQILPSSSNLTIIEESSLAKIDGDSFAASPLHRTVSKNATEDYNCAVCLEQMEIDSRDSSTADVHDATRVSILTTVCNHSFHMDCLLQWQDSPCPVCRYDHSGLNEALSQCHVCGTTEHNYVCLICGVVSCGDGGDPSSHTAATTRPSASLTECRSDDTLETTGSQHHHTRIMMSSHARTHYDKTLHAYALNTETQHVWDFAGQGYVHRLLQNKEDGKLVEVSDPNNTTSQERSLSPGLTEAQEGEVVHRKLEGFASQYYTLLKSQLEQQRIHYEGRLEEIRREYSDTRCVSAADLLTALKQERHQLSQRLLSVQTKCRKVQGDVGFTKSLNESLEANREPLRRQVEDVQRDRMDARKVFEERVSPLQESVTRLMLRLESSNSGAADAADAISESSKKPAAR